MTGHPLTVAAELAEVHAIRPSTLTAVVYAARGATSVSVCVACRLAAEALAEDERTAPTTLRPAIAELTAEVTEWAEAA